MKIFISLLMALIVIGASAQDSTKPKVKISKFNNKKFSKKNLFYIFENGSATGGKSWLYIVQPKRSFWGNLKEEGSAVFVRQDDKERLKDGKLTFTYIDTIEVNDPPNSISGFSGQTYFPEVFFPKDTADILLYNKNRAKYRWIKSIRYCDYKFMLQAITVPIKYRRSIDSLPYQTETGANLAIGMGVKFAKNWYMANKSFLGQKTNQISFTPGILFGFGATDVKANGQAIKKDRKEPIFSYGIFFLVGVNNINLGITFGQDQALKDGGKTGGWLYDGKGWVGFTFALDILK